MSFQDRLTISIPTLATKIGADRTWIYRVIEGKSSCSAKMAKRIEDATEGEIKAVWLLGLETPPAHPHSSLEAAV